MKPTSYPALDSRTASSHTASSHSASSHTALSRTASSRMALVPLGLSFFLLLGACGSVETTGSTQDADPLAAVELGMQASSEANREARRELNSAVRPASAQLIHSPAAIRAAKPTHSTPGTKVQSTLSDEQAAELAIRLAQGRATQADKRALHAYLEDSR